MANAGLLLHGGHHRHIANFRQLVPQGTQARGEDSVVVGQ